jgi:hypothetical protein
MDIDSPSATKRSASLVAQAEEQVDNKKNKDGKSKANPQKAGTAVSRRIVQVVIQSPKIAPQRRKRRRVEEDVESQKRDSEERDEETSVEPWVGKGQARSISLLYYEYKHFSFLTNRIGVSGAGS